MRSSFGGAGASADRIESLAADIAAIRDGRRIVLVSSGAVVSGMARLKLPERPRSIPEKQAAAAVGQSTLMWQYEAAFGRHRVQVGQVLLTAQDISDRARYLNAKNTLLALLKFDVLPIVNENDTVAVEEIKVGDNDNLSALVASLIDADLLVLLTDVDGLYTEHPAVNARARKLDTVEAVTEDAEITAFGVLPDEVANCVFAQSASFGHPWNLDFRIAQADPWIESATRGSHCVRRHGFVVANAVFRAICR